MFDVYCSGHGSRVLMGMDSVRRLRNTAHGPEVEWRCSCGTTGTWQPHRGAGSAAKVH
ncbi:MAG: hypothetical protein JWM12_4052 [Ilumatobacteraceae bacterium]|jgi:hypothetical protein|nr:hypothetical protein [Ilumatobacteraceae bacterium]